MAVLMMVYGFWHLRRGSGPKGQDLSSLQAWLRRAPDGTTGRIAGVKPIEQIVSPGDAQKTSQQQKKAAPFVLIFAVLFASLAVYQAAALVRLQSAGVRAEGQVVSLKAESSQGGSYSYYPIVRYRTSSNLTFEFKDNIGSNPPRYRAGDKVTVLYLADSPRTQVMIDRGPFWNWSLPAVLGAAALALFWLWSFLRRAVSPAAPVDRAAPSPIRIAT